jgi:cation transport ATPase
VSLLYFVSGMFCGTCAKTVESRILSLPEVSSAELSFASKLLRVRLAPTVDIESAATTIEREIARGGFSGKRQKAGWIESFQNELAKEQAQAVPPWLLAVVFFFAMWSSTTAFARYLGALTADEEFLLSGLSTAIGAPALILGAYPFARAGLRALARGRILTLDLFIALGAVSAFAVSLAHLWSGSSHSYVDSAAMVIVVLLSAKLAEARLAGTLAGRILYHIGSEEQMVERLDCAGTRTVPVTGVRRGDTVAFPPGQTVALDGELVSARAVLNSHLLSGEAEDQAVLAGAFIHSGTIARSRVEILVTEPVGYRRIDSWAESALISQSRPHRYSRLLQKLEGRLTLFALAGAALLGILRYAQTGLFMLAAESFFVGVLIFCPCLFASILPLAKQMAHLALARLGVICYRAECLFDLASTERVYFDKTGTLEGIESTFVPDHDCHRAQGRSLALLRNLRRHTYHPVLQGLDIPEADCIDPGQPELIESPGSGVEAHWPDTGETMIVGRPSYVHQRLGQALPENGAEDALVAVGGQTVGRLVSSSVYERKANHCLSALRTRLPACSQIEILSGDPKPEAGLRYTESGLHYRGGLSPTQKAALVGDRSLFVGDGLNDTLALAKATVSLRVGQRVRGFAPVDLLLLQPDLDRLLGVIDYARKFTRVLVQTTLLAGTYNLVAWTLAALGSFTPLGAVLAMLTSLLLMFASILRLLRPKA